MICFAKHNWSYNHLYREERYILSKIRLIVEDHLHETSKTLSEKGFQLKKKRAICELCKDDLIDEQKAVCTFNCGHTFHDECISTIISCVHSPSVCPICKRKLNSPHAIKCTFT